MLQVQVLPEEPDEKGPKLKGLLVNRRPVPREGSASCSFYRRDKEIRHFPGRPSHSLFPALTWYPRRNPSGCVWGTDCNPLKLSEAAVSSHPLVNSWATGHGWAHPCNAQPPKALPQALSKLNSFSRSTFIVSEAEGHLSSLTWPLHPEGKLRARE